MQAGAKKKPDSSKKSKASQEGDLKNGKGKFKLSVQAKEFIEKRNEHGASLKDLLLLTIKDGTEHVASELFKKLQEQIPADLVVEDPKAAKPKELKAGRQALLARTLELLVAAKKVTVKNAKENGLWADESKVKLVPPEGEKRFEIDKEFKNIMPPQSPGEIAELERQLLTQGCRDLLTVWEHGERTFLVDGHTRLEICLRHDIENEVRSISLPDRAAVREWIWTQHYGRRNLTPEAESYRRGQLFNRIKQRGGDRSKGAKAQNAPLDEGTAKALAQEFKVSRGTIIRDGGFAERVDKIIEASGERGDEFRQKLLSRSLRLTAAEIKQLAAKAKSEIVGLVKRLLEGERPDLGSGKDSTVLRIVLPRGKPAEQAQVLLEMLKRPHLLKLIEELTRLVRKDGEEVHEEGKKNKGEYAVE